MRVVGDDRAAVVAARRIDGPVVRRGPRQRRLDARRTAALGCALAPQIDDVGAGDRQRHVAARRIARRAPEHGPIEARRRRRQEVVQRRRQHGVHDALRALVRVVVRQHRVERQHDEQTVLGCPRPRRRAGEPILGRPRAQVGEAGVDAFGVGVEPRVLLGRQRRAQPPRVLAIAERALAAIGRERALAEQLGELAGARAAQQVHLKEALLRVQVALAAQHVGERLAAHGRNRARVERDRQRRREPRQRRFAAAARQRRGDERVGRGDEQQHEAGRRREQAFDQVESPNPSAYRGWPLLPVNAIGSSRSKAGLPMRR